MAAQQIPLTGTGEILIKYTESSVEKSIRVLSPTTGLYLNDANTGFKYKVLSGSVTIGSTGIISFAPITSAYKKLVWDGIFPTNNCYSPYESIVFKSLVVGTNTYNFDQQVNFLGYSSAQQVSDQIYKLNNPNITPTSTKYEEEFKTGDLTGTVYIKLSLIVNIEDLTGDVYLKYINSTSNLEYLIKGATEASAIPTGFTATSNPCSVAPIT